MDFRGLLVCGIFAAVAYVVAVIFGAGIRPGYSHIGNFVSELIETGAPNKGLLNPLFAIYNLLTGAFAVGLLIFIRVKSPPAATDIGNIGAIVLIAEAIFGMLTIFFPQDVRGTPATTTGKIHIILAGLSSLTTMLAMLLLGLWFRGQPGMASYVWYSFISLGIVFISGGLTAYTGATNSPILGLMERITIGGFLQWMLVLGVRLSNL